MRFPVDVVFRNELLRSGKNLPTCYTQAEYEERAAKCREEATRSRSFAVWVGIERGGKEHEIARGLK